MTRLRKFTNLRLVLPVLIALGSGLAACDQADMAEDEAEPAIDTEMSVATEEGIATVSYFSDWDLDDDTYLSEDEWGAGWESLTLWEDWDTDADASLSQEEFDAKFGDYDWYDESLYADWDTNDDDLLGEDEFGTGLYDTWDADEGGTLGEDEFDTGLFE